MALAIAIDSMTRHCAILWKKLPDDIRQQVT